MTQEFAAAAILLLLAQMEQLFSETLCSVQITSVDVVHPLSPLAISIEPGSAFQAFNGTLTGATLQIIPRRLVIQSWRSTKFNDGDPGSTLILAFTPEGTNGGIDLVHLDVPAHNYQSVVEGWETHYWGPWRRYLAG